MTTTTQTASKATNVQLKWLFLFLFCLVIWNAASDVAMAATLTTDATRYFVNTSIILNWNYTSKYTGNERDFNKDSVVIMNSGTIPTFSKFFVTTQMGVFVSTLNLVGRNATLRNIGTVTFDGSAPDETFAQSWPLQVGLYKAYLVDYSSTSFSIYAESDAFSVVPFLSTNKPSYYFDESITFSWGYKSDYTDTGVDNADALGIYDSTIMNTDLSSPIMFLWISKLENGANNYNKTIRNTGMVTFDSGPPNESGLKSWPLKVGSYKAILLNIFQSIPYTESSSFVIVPATASPTKTPTKIPTEAPTKAPSKTPTKVPTKVPTKLPTKEPTKSPTMIPIPLTTTPSMTPLRTNKNFFCNVFLLRYFLCFDECGWIGQLLKTCK